MDNKNGFDPTNSFLIGLLVPVFAVIFHFLFFKILNGLQNISSIFNILQWLHFFFYFPGMTQFIFITPFSKWAKRNEKNRFYMGMRLGSIPIVTLNIAFIIYFVVAIFRWGAAWG
ncbi:MAG: hypothetical protein HRT89_07660 [Lentisphaeria bacterium]|nr:hypothetical protein [Lentisphaeria bacterium]NQZ67930.1 hypothetical protein [Lentisphaeria bacterium]